MCPFQRVRSDCRFVQHHTLYEGARVKVPRCPAVVGVGGGASLGALVGIGIWFALMSVTFMYESRRPALFPIDGGYHVLALTIAGAILGAWPPG